ncbi:T7SS effector LXG polymorphic toxin [Psychrobacillus sp. FSL K6-2684]|uniref:T7SS effector LXG polymorphic toxin n=1 Tax=unclassified Psychrobacillus TaxID=2636677 RepID=UPI0012480EB0|nr:T7SS effector LXG polymorphic toxin [Psychrobacillus sp. AK 1817]QEY19994.1 hypothetical protein D0S48_04395 [Psychrobacillus sp. AK 1817]
MHLDDSGMQEGFISSKRKRDDTLNQLYGFDATQTYALNPIEQGLQMMDTWLTENLWTISSRGQGYKLLAEPMGCPYV